MIYNNTETEELLEVENIDKITFSNKVILFNDDWHSFDEVINQIMKATGVSVEIAEQLTLEVHNSGKACVYTGSMVECLKVSSILEEIGLHTQIEY